MSNAFFKVPVPVNEPVLSYDPLSSERKEVKAVIKELKSKKVDITPYVCRCHLCV